MSDFCILCGRLLESSSCDRCECMLEEYEMDIYQSKWKRFKVGQQVAYKEGFTNIVRLGKVVSVTSAPNGYPVTIVDFPNWKGEIEFAVEALKTPDQFQQSVNWWAE